MTPWYSSEQVQVLIETAVAKAVAPLKARIAELEAEVARLKKIRFIRRMDTRAFGPGFSKA